MHLTPRHCWNSASVSLFVRCRVAWSHWFSWCTSKIWLFHPSWGPPLTGCDKDSWIFVLCLARAFFRSQHFRVLPLRLDMFYLEKVFGGSCSIHARKIKKTWSFIEDSSVLYQELFKYLSLHGTGPFGLHYFLMNFFSCYTIDLCFNRSYGVSQFGFPFMWWGIFSSIEWSEKHIKIFKIEKMAAVFLKIFKIDFLEKTTFFVDWQYYRLHILQVWLLVNNFILLKKTFFEKNPNC